MHMKNIPIRNTNLEKEWGNDYTVISHWTRHMFLTIIITVIPLVIYVLIIMYAGYCSMYFMEFNSLTFTTVLWNRYYYYASVRDEETKE